MSDPHPRDPWDKYGWSIGVVWLGFLGFPAYAAMTASTAWGWRLVTLVLIAGFGAVYAYGSWRASREDTMAQVRRTGWRYVAAMVLIMALVLPVARMQTLGMVTFVVAFGMFTLPLGWALGVFAAGLAATIAWPYAEGVLSDTWLLTLIVVMVGVSTLTVRLVEVRQERHRAMTDELALVAERERVARDVHDVLGHSLTVVTVKAELAERLVDLDPARAKVELAEIRDLTRQSLAEVRATVAGLRVARLTDELVAARSALVGAGIEAEVADDVAVVDPRHRMVLAWTLREAVTNVVRHSGATRCTVRLGPSWLEVSDDGRGPGEAAEGNGLRGIRERIARSGGSLLFGSGPAGAGTTVRVEI